MRIGYPCINTSIGCTANSTFRLKNYTQEQLNKKIAHNLGCLKKILEYNKKNNLLFFRIGSQLIPFASHNINKENWWQTFKKQFKDLGIYIKENNMRISMHPDQFTIINAKDKEIVQRSVAELDYHCRVLDLLGLDNSAKVQIHVGGVYGDKQESMKRFCKEYKKLPEKIKNRLAIENDHVSYTIKDCMEIHKKIKIPIILDTFHHEVKNNGESITEVFNQVKKTWKKTDGVPMIDYSSQKKDARKGTHSESINMSNFKKITAQLKGDYDLMLEIKDKEKSALKISSIGH